MKLSRLFLFISCACVGCTGTYSHDIRFNPTESLRIAVLPFVMKDSEGATVNAPSPISSDDATTPVQYVEKLVTTELSATALDIVAPALVSAQLSHHGFATPQGVYFSDKIEKIDPKELCEKLLQCDAVLRGNVTKWSQSYYGVQSETQVAFNLEIISARTGQVLFKTAADDSTGQGLLRIPTGFTDLFLEPLKGLRTEKIRDLAQRSVTKALSPLKPMLSLEKLAAPPPQIFGAAHDAPSSGKLSSTQSLKVVMLGSPKLHATFSLGSKIQHVAMIETDGGHYFGEYAPLAQDSFSNAPLTVSLLDDAGREAVQQVGNILLTREGSAQK